MPWLELEAAAARGFSRRTWESWIEAGRVTSYLDGGGRRMVWLEEDAPLQMALAGFTTELRELRREVGRLREELRSTLQRSTQQAEAPVELSPTATRTLELVEARWDGSDRELERQAGLPLRFLTKGRRGERNGARAEASWTRLERFLQRRAA